MKRVATAFAGGRNDALNVAALKLGSLVARGWLDQGRVERALEDAAQANGLSRDDGIASVRATIKSGIDAGICEPATRRHVRVPLPAGAATASLPHRSKTRRKFRRRSRSTPTR